MTDLLGDDREIMDWVDHEIIPSQGEFSSYFMRPASLGWSGVTEQEDRAEQDLYQRPRTPLTSIKSILRPA